MKRAVEESQGVEKYDYLVINDDLERCAKEMHSIIQGEHDRVSRNADFIDDIRKELKELWERSRIYVTSIIYRFDESSKSGR